MQQEFQEDLYGILGVDESASSDEIRKAYLKLAKKLHPDRFPNDPEKRLAAQQEFAKITRAHDIIADPKQRDEYDALRNLARSRSGESSAASGGQAASQMASGQQGPAGEPGSGSAVKSEAQIRDQWAGKHHDRAIELLKRKKYPEAETAIKEAIRLNAQNAAFHATLAEIHFQRGWRTLSMTAVQQALKLDPKNYEAKDIELRIKAMEKKPGDTGKSGQGEAKKGILEQLKELLNKKI